MKSTIKKLLKAILFRTVTVHGRVRLLNRGILHVAQDDNRGQAILQNAGVTQPPVTLFWHVLIRQFRPTLVLDIGANYGEIGLSSRYAPETLIHFFEPNPIVRKFLVRSIQTHRNRQQITVHDELVSDACGQAEFIVDRKWSGTSSAVGEIGRLNGVGSNHPECLERITTDTITIDAALSRVAAIPSHRLLFKVDVEGYEAKVWDGMLNTLRSVEAFVGIIEFDKDYLEAAKTNPASFFSSLKQRGKMALIKSHKLIPIDHIDSLPSHSDIVIASSQELLEAVRLPAVAALALR